MLSFCATRSALSPARRSSMAAARRATMAWPGVVILRAMLLARATARGSRYVSSRARRNRLTCDSGYVTPSRCLMRRLNHADSDTWSTAIGARQHSRLRSSAWDRSRPMLSKKSLTVFLAKLSGVFLPLTDVRGRFVGRFERSIFSPADWKRRATTFSTASANISHSRLPVVRSFNQHRAARVSVTSR
jgi:hypothetical protein